MEIIMSRNQPEYPIAVDRLIVINCFDLSPKFALSKDKHEGWEFVYVDSGEISCPKEDGERTLKQGDIVFHRPGEIHSTICNGRRAASIFNVIFECRSEALSCFDGRSFRVPQSLIPLLKRLIAESKSTYHISKHPLQLRKDAPVGGEQLTKLYIEEFLILLLRTCSCNDEELEPPCLSPEEEGDTLTEAVCAYLEDNVYGKVTLKELTESFHFGKSYLYARFKQSKGCSIMSYYLDLKLAEAKRLLREDSLPIHEIAERLGFESPEYFSRYFRKRVGHSPRDFRNMLINDASLTHRDS